MLCITIKLYAKKGGIVAEKNYVKQDRCDTRKGMGMLLNQRRA